MINRSAVAIACLATAVVTLAAEQSHPGRIVSSRDPDSTPSIDGDGLGPPDVARIRGIAALGAGSCATGSCHGGPKAGNHDVQSFAATIWTNDDPHASAFESLHSTRSQRMAALLGLPPAHEAATCLACHSVQASCREKLPAAVLADGVACGSCHGDATAWIARHTLPDWRSLPVAEKERMGFWDLGDVTSRVRNCIPCHVGDETREVGHDLIAAGHPRLTFEFAAYQRLWPRHWSPEKRLESSADFAERSWAVGQAETIAAVAGLLATRARRAAGEHQAGDDAASAGRQPWPEFAEFDCYACHRALSPDRVGIELSGNYRNPVPGTPSWQPWTASAGRLLSAGIDPPITGDVTRSADALVATLRPQWAATDSARLEAIISRADELHGAARRASREIDGRPRVVLDGSSGLLDELIVGAPSEWRFWDAAVQSVLLVEASREGGPARRGQWPLPNREPAVSETRRGLDELRRSLQFPVDAGGPEAFDPQVFQDSFRRLP